ncbi:MAG: ATP-grasp domain-containing protein [Luteolibacter sp.]
MMEDRFLINECLWMVTVPTHVPVYDFDFCSYFDCRCPYEFAPDLPGVARVGAIEHYAGLYESLLGEGIRLVNSPEQHERASNLPIWYPLLEGRTPRSRWFEEFPDFEELEAEFGLPLFLKGSRQTSRHRADLSIIRSREDYLRAVEIYRCDPILHWQQFVCREFALLRPVMGGDPSKIPASFEFRTFWWQGRHVGSGRYWYEAAPYDWTPAERDAVLGLAGEAAQALDCGFLVIDLAMTKEGFWTIIECNDGMESGYAGVSPFALWRKVVECM